MKLPKDLLTVRQAKFYESGQLPLHPSDKAELFRYRTLSNQQDQQYAYFPSVGTGG